MPASLVRMLQIFYPPLSLVLLLILLKLADVFDPSPTLANSPLYLWIFPINLGLGVYCLTRGKNYAATDYFLCFIPLFLFGTSGIYFSSTPYFERLKLEAFPKRYDQCKQTALFYNEAKSVGLCECFDRIGYFDGIVYDSGGQVFLRPGQRIAEWDEAVKKDGAIKHNICLEGLVDYKRSRYLGNNYYYVNFDISQ